MPSHRSTPHSALPETRTAPPEAERAVLLDRFNTAVRCPGAHGGPGELAPLLDALAVGADRPDGGRWIVDDNARLDLAALLRYCFPQPEIHVVAAEFGAAAHARGWLRLDRTLPADEYTALMRTAEHWAASDRTLDDVLRTYGPPSVVFGDPAPRAAKTLGYGCADRAQPLALLHFAAAGDSPSARLLAFRGGNDMFDAGLAFTPLGDTLADESERHRT